MSVKLNSIEWTTWEDVRKQVFTPEEIVESDFRVALISKLAKDRQCKELSQEELKELSSVKQTIIVLMKNALVTYLTTEHYFYID